MIYNAEEWARLRNAVLAVSLIAWIVILLEPRVSSCCSANGAVVSWKMLLAANPPGSLAMDWVLMLIAMMAPMLVAPLYHIRISSFARRRLRSMALFVAGYGAVWMTAGVVIVGVGLAATWLFPRSYFPAMTVGLIALIWQVSPFKQRCLNRCHSHRPLAAFGIAADLDVLRLGLENGLWCTGSCWAAMLFPMLLPDWHFVAMAAVALLMFCERLDPPRTPAWQWRGFGTAARCLSIRLRGPEPEPAPLTVTS
jgi:predicted metal-binding membrane protein